MYYACKVLAGSEGFEPPDHEWSPGYRPGGINRSPNSPSMIGGSKLATVCYRLFIFCNTEIAP